MSAITNEPGHLLPANMPMPAFFKLSKTAEKMIDNKRKGYTMTRLLLFILSYGSFLLILTPRVFSYIVASFVIFVCGICAAVYKKIRGANLKKNNSLSIYIYSIFIPVCFGYTFYYRWLSSKLLLRVTSALHIPHEVFLLLVTLLLSILSMYFIFVFLQAVSSRGFGTNHVFARDLLVCMAASVFPVCIAQVMIEKSVFLINLLNFLYGCLTVVAVILFLYCLIGKILPSVYFGTGIFTLISTINVYVYKFRARLFEPTDIFSAFTAAKVAGSYNFFPLPSSLVFGWGIFACMIAVLSVSQRDSKPGINIKLRLCALALCIICSISVFSHSQKLTLSHWKADSAAYNGYILDFVSKIRELSVSKPDGYSPEAISSLADKYADEGNAYETGMKKLPTIIVIMDESFSDLSVTADFTTNTEVMPFISSLKENTVSGHALVSVFGGNTANSEYEFLTGNSMAWLTPSAVPYVQYVRSPVCSMVSYLKSSYNYKCVAMHPFNADSWNRPAAYERLGFDEMFFIDDFPSDSERVRECVSDSSMFDFVIGTHEEHEGEPLFIFGITMQNHGGYSYDSPDFENSISLTGHEGEFYDVEQYLTLIRETDRAAEHLITYFQNVDDEVLIVLFGDHQPSLEESFYETVGKSTDTLDGQQKRYEVPFFIWANYDIEEKYVDCTSLNYLSNYVYEAAGLELPPYNRFLRDMEKIIPSINVNGYYSLEKGCYLPFEAADGEERQWLDAYEALQYNCIFDKKNQNKVFFPTVN